MDQFSSEWWKNRSKKNIPEIPYIVHGLQERKVRYEAYSALAAIALWPLVETVIQAALLKQPIAIATYITLGSLTGGIGGNLIAEQLQYWRDSSDEVTLLTIGTWVSKIAPVNADLRQSLDKIIATLEIIEQISLSPDDTLWYETALRSELLQMQTLSSATTTIHIKDGGVAIGNNNVVLGARGVFVGGDVAGDIITGDHNIIGIGVNIDSRTQQLHDVYLRHFMSQVHTPTLFPIEPLTGSKDGLNLQQLYVPLLTLGMDRFDENKFSRLPHEYKTIPAMSQLNRHRHLILLGDPGSGKTTFLNFVGLCMAGELLGNSQTNLSLLTQSFPENGLLIQKWEHGALLPVRVMLRDFVAGGMLRKEEPASAQHLMRFIRNEVAQYLPDYVDPLSEHLYKQGGLILLDGLDEIPEVNGTRQQVMTIIGQFATTFQNCRILITSRTYAIQESYWKSHNFDVARLIDFSIVQIHYSIQHRYKSIGKLKHLTEANIDARIRSLQNAIQHAPRLLELARNPMLLALIVALHEWYGHLPANRDELYDDIINLLLYRRDALRFQSNFTQESLSPNEELAINPDKVRHILNKLAFNTYQDNTTYYIHREELLHAFDKLDPKLQTDPQLFIKYLEQRTGLLVVHSPNTFQFSSLILQEYLVACYLVDHDYPTQAAMLARTNSRHWREVVILATMRAMRGSPYAFWAMIDELCPYSINHVNDIKNEDVWGAQIAGQLLAEVFFDFNHLTNNEKAKLERVKGWLYHIVHSKLVHSKFNFPENEMVTANHILKALQEQSESLLTADIDIDIDIVLRFLKSADLSEHANFHKGILVNSSLKFWRQHQLPIYVYSDALAHENLDLAIYQDMCNSAKMAHVKLIILPIKRKPEIAMLHQIAALRLQEKMIIVPISLHLMQQALLEGRAIEVCHEQISEQTGDVDLYDRHGAVSDVLSFFGRTNLLASLEQCLTTRGQSLMLLGIRKVGKSSLLIRLREETEWPIAVIDLQQYQGALSDLYTQAIRGWSAAIRIQHRELDLPSRFTDIGEHDNDPLTAQHFRSLVAELLNILAKKSSALGLILVLDEMEYLQNKEDDYYDLASILRAFAESSEQKGRFSLLLAGLDPALNRIDHLGKTDKRRNPFFSFFVEQSVGMLDRKSVEEMIISVGGQMSVKYEQDALDYLADIGGGHAFLTRRLCSWAINGRRDRPLTITLLEAQQAVKRYIADPDNYMSRSLWGIDDNDSEAGPDPAIQQQLQLLAAEQFCTTDQLVPPMLLPSEQRSYHIAFETLRYQCLIEDPEEADRWRLTLPLYRRWIRYYILNMGEEADA